MVSTIAGEGYRVSKLFSHYSKYPYESDYHVGTDILIFFQNYKANYEIKPGQNSGSYFYELRNTIVHNLRILFSGTEADIQNKQKDLQTLIDSVEFLTIETLLGLNV